jgi:hypothetical protein
MVWDKLPTEFLFSWWCAFNNHKSHRHQIPKNYCWMPSKRVTRWTLENAEGLLYTSRAACWSWEEFCSLLTNKLQWLAKLQDPWRSGFLIGVRIYPLHLLNPSTNLNINVNTLLTAYLVAQFQTVRALFAACTGAYFGFRCQHWPMKWTFFVTRETLSGVLYPHL